MNLLIDTHVLLWWATSSKRLGRQASDLLSEPHNTVWVSAASIWEISIKISLKRLDSRLTSQVPENLESNGFRPLPITIAHALAVRDLPHHHGDPFDRILIAQAQCEDLTLLTADAAIQAYDVRTIDAAR